MSKLADKIRSATRSQPQQVGFGAARPSGAATLVLAGIARDAREAADLIGKGADVALIGSFDSPAAKNGAGDAKNAVLGARIAGKAADEAQVYREAGYDFVVFDPDRASASTLLDEKVGYVMLLPAGLSDLEIRAIDLFRLDAIDVGDLSGALTVRRQIDLQRVTAVTRKPLMAGVPKDIAPAELRALRDSGVAVVAVAAAGVEQLRKTIDALPPRPNRRDDRDRPSAIVSHHVAAHEDEDDDDD